MMKKKWMGLLAVTLALTTAGLSPAALAAGKYKDVTADAWFAPALDSFSSVGLISGYPDGTFQADNTVTRAEFITILYNIMDRPAVEGVTTGFSDVEGTWFEKQVKYAVQAKLFDNVAWSGKFDADQPVNRGEAAVLIWNLIGDDSFRNITPDDRIFPNYFVFDTKANMPFTDALDAPRFTKYDVAQLYTRGVVHGFPDNTYRYGQSITRAEATLLLQTALKKVEYPKIAPPVVYNATTNVNNLIDLGDGTYSFGNIYLDKYKRGGRTEEQIITDTRKFLNARVIPSGNKVTVKVPDTGTDDVWWTIGTYNGRGAYQETFSNDGAVNVEMFSRINAQVLVEAYLVYRDGTWKAEYHFTTK
ncbi:S-layer homology domain-containing protein [Tumebacillus permanentifrigoris]|uniref:S-layer family protein n=1 Tax=Tumebacillus permanentifrigoris TaxID=378543 RepID=A0A316D2I3_9BACL|nr:S-layer homology domain-containing protein [Tumebacillus permanentifrigoris]PWK05004.1 S-layer family protein [Tumebacillus permanentifrigoris]